MRKLIGAGGVDLGLELSLMLFQDFKGFGDLHAEGVGGFEEVEELGVIHLQEHPGNLPGELGLGVVD